MSRFTESLDATTDVGFWQPAVQSQFSANTQAVEDRLDALQQAIAEQQLRAWFGHEIEYYLEPLDPNDGKPDKEEFYETLVRRLCGGTYPPGAGKGRLVDPFTHLEPIIMNYNGEGTYNPDQPGSDISEIRTAPGEWRTAEHRYWQTLGAIGSLAASRNLRARIANTHMSSVTARVRRDESAYVENDNFKLPGDMLIATQRARRYLQPFDAYAAFIPGDETYPTKAGRWTVERYRVETRFPGFGIVDSRPSMLGVLAGIQQVTDGAFPLKERDTLHRCQLVDFISDRFPELETLNGLLVWDEHTKQMVLPQRMSRANVLATNGAGADQKLDGLLDLLVPGLVADFSDRDALVLRMLVRDLTMDESGQIWPKRGERARLWARLTNFARAYSSPTVRVVAASPYRSSRDPLSPRRQATRSREVAKLLGKDLQKSLTSPAKAAAIRKQAVLASA